MRAYKMFEQDMTCTKGRGVFQYELGGTYREKEANCARNGFHCAENPLDCLSYYPDMNHAVCCEVEAGGSIDEDNRDSKISCTEIRILRKLTLQEFVMAAAVYMIDHPKMPLNSHVSREPAAAGNNHFAIVRCEEPAARGKLGDIICCLRDVGGRITDACIYRVDGDSFLPDTWYDVQGREREYAKA